MRAIAFLVFAWAAATVALISTEVDAKLLGGLFLTFCSLQTNGQNYCFGLNKYGNLGIGKQTAKYAAFPKQMLNVQFAIDVSVGQTHTCIVDKGNTAKCVGNNLVATLGDGNQVDSSVLVQVHGLTSQVEQVFAGYQHSCALLTTGAAKCWGDNEFGALGDGTRVMRKSPVAVWGFEFSGVENIALGQYHTCIVSTKGEVQCSGRDYYGQLGDGSNVDRLQMGPVNGLPAGESFVGISCGSVHSCALSKFGNVYCWGQNSNGQLGQGHAYGISTVPLQPAGLAQGAVKSIWSAYNSNFFVLRGNRTVVAFGENTMGALGTGDLQQRSVPVIVGNGIVGVEEVRGGSFTSCVMTTLRSVHCVGSDQYGALGNDELLQRSLKIVSVLNLPITAAPTNMPTMQPVASPSLSPVVMQTTKPTIVTNTPTARPITTKPTNAPTLTPSVTRTLTPSLSPSYAPTFTPTLAPTVVRTPTPTLSPTVARTPTPTLTPTVARTSTPTLTPTVGRTLTPSLSPSAGRTLMPIVTPSIAQTFTPNVEQTLTPTLTPSAGHTLMPTATPSVAQTFTPTLTPSNTQTLTPSSIPTSTPTTPPSTIPTSLPTPIIPLATESPSSEPTIFSPTLSPSTRAPTSWPSSNKPTYAPRLPSPTPRPTTTTTTTSVLRTRSPTILVQQQPTSSPTAKEQTGIPTVEVSVLGLVGLVLLLPCFLLLLYCLRRLTKVRPRRRSSLTLNNNKVGFHHNKTVRFE